MLHEQLHSACCILGTAPILNLFMPCTALCLVSGAAFNSADSKPAFCVACFVECGVELYYRYDDMI